MGAHGMEIHRHRKGFLAWPGDRPRGDRRPYNLTMDPYEKYDMIFNGAAPMRVMTSSPGRYAGEDNGWVLSLISPVIVDFDKSIMKYPSIKRFPGGASTDLTPDLQHPENPLPLLKELQEQPQPVGGGGG